MRLANKLIILSLLLPTLCFGQGISPTPSSGGGGAPSGPAGGSLGGTYPNPTVVTNANLTGPITSVGNATSIASQTGTGTKFVVDAGPTITNLIIGAGSAITSSGAGGSLGALSFITPASNVATFLTTPSSANFGAALTDKTGTGVNVFATSPTLVTPILGVATATSISAANYYGGSGAGSVLNLQSTSNGSPSGDSITLTAGGSVRQTILSGGNTGIGTETNPQFGLVVSKNTTTGIIGASATGSALFVNANGSSTIIALESYGTGVIPSIALDLARGTAASPTAIQLNDVVGQFGWRGYDGVAWSIFQARIIGVALETWQNSPQHIGIGFEFDTTAAGGNTRAQAMRVVAGVIIGAGTTDPGANNAIIGGTLTISGIATDAAQTDNTVCVNSSGLTLKGSGTLGICLGTSSARYKPFRAPLQVGLAQIIALEPIKYTLDREHGNPDKILYGFTAEQGGSILPDLLGRDIFGQPNTFDYLGIVPVLVKAMQEQQSQINELKQKIN